MLRRNGASPAISSLALLHPLSPGSSAYTGGVGGPIIKGPDDPQVNFFQIPETVVEAVPRKQEKHGKNSI